MARPKSIDPSTQKAVYPRRSVWETVETLAAERGKKPAEMAVILMEIGIGSLRNDADSPQGRANARR